MEYILSGDQLHVEHILQENARRVALGWVKFTPVSPDTGVHYLAAEDTKNIGYTDSKDPVVNADTKTTVTSKSTKKTE